MASSSGFPPRMSPARLAELWEVRGVSAERLRAEIVSWVYRQSRYRKWHFYNHDEPMTLYEHAQIVQRNWGPAAFPDLPTVGDFLLGFEGAEVTGIAAPKNTPNEVVAKLNREINVMVADPRMKARIAEVGGEALTGSSTEFAKLIENEAEKWCKVIQAANIKPE